MPETLTKNAMSGFLLSPYIQKDIVHETTHVVFCALDNYPEESQKSFTNLSQFPYCF